MRRAELPMHSRLYLLSVLLGLLFSHGLLALDSSQIPDVLSEEIARFQRLMSSPIPEYRIEGAQGARLLRLQTFEPELIKLLKDEDPMVRQEAVLALGDCGTWRSVLHLIALLDDPQWAVREHARLSLLRMTGQAFGAWQNAEWEEWWNSATIEEKQARLWEGMESEDGDVRCASARGLRCMATPAMEDKLLKLLTEGSGIGERERALLTEALDRIGTSKSMPYLLEHAGAGDVAAAWALGSRGGKEVEEALLKGLQRNARLDFMLNLDRVKSSACGPLLAQFCRDFTTLLLRGDRTDDVQYGPTPLQRVTANLIRRSGEGPMLCDLVISEIEGKPKKDIPKQLLPHVEGLRAVLARDFTRNDGGANACLLSALYHVCDDPAFAPRLIPLLKHKSHVTVVYVALTLGKLQAADAVGPILEVINTPYPFCDSTAQASGKHEKQSWTVRWHGYLAMALGHIGSEQAREALEELALNPSAARDVRYGAVVGLGYIQSAKSLAALRKVESGDIIWMIRERARRTIADIEMANHAKTARAGDTPAY